MIVALFGTGAFVVAMLPLRAHMSVATAALILVVPVVLSVAVGGFPAGLLAVAAGFVAYDFFFIPPYLTLDVGQLQDWAALGVYAVTMVVVARVVSALRDARARAWRREDDTRRLFELSVLLLDDEPAAVLLSRVATSICEQFAFESVAALVPVDGELSVAAEAGTPIDRTRLEGLMPRGGVLVPAGVPEQSGLRLLPMASRDRAVGLLALDGPALNTHDARLLETFANQTALSLERAMLRRQAIRTEALEAADALRRSLVGSVSHNLRTPLATIKAAVSDLRDPSIRLADEDRRELLGAIEDEADRLARLVRNLLDMSRIEAGMLRPKVEPAELGELIEAAVGHLGSYWVPSLEVSLPDDLPLLQVDRVLVEQVLANLLENAVRHAPAGGPVRVRAFERADRVVVEVSDHGPGFRTLRESSSDGSVPGVPGVPGIPGGHLSASIGPRSSVLPTDVWSAAARGTGLAICNAFVQAHGGRIELGETPGGGATVRLDLPACSRFPTKGAGELAHAHVATAGSGR